MRNSVTRKIRLQITFAFSFFLFIHAMAQVKLDGISVMDGSLDYTKRCRVKFIYTKDRKPDTLSYNDAKNNRAGCGDIKRLQFLPAKVDINDFYAVEPIECAKLSAYKPVVKIPLLSKTNSPPLAYDGIINPAATIYYMRDPEADRLVWKVCDQLKNEKFTEKLMVVGASVPTFAENRVLRGTDIDCYLYYNPDTLARLIRNGDSLVICGIILHEMGHIFNMHTLHMDSTNIDAELAADRFAGRWLFSMGADTTTILKMVSFIHNEKRTEYYPSREERYTCLMNGWKLEQKKVADRIFSDSITEAAKLDTARILFQAKRYNEALDILRTRSMGLRYLGNRLNAEKMLGQVFYMLAETDGTNWPKAIEHFDIYLASKKDVGIFYEAGYASFRYGACKKANAYFRKALSMKPGRDLARDAYLYYGICLERSDSLSAALEAYNNSVKADCFNPVPYLYRARLRKQLYPDTLSLALDDYMKAFNLLPGLREQDTLRRTITELTRQLFAKAIQRGRLLIMTTYRELRCLQFYRLDTIPPEFNFQMALVYNTFDILKDSLHRSNDSLILYCSKYLELKPSDSAKALLLKGQTWYAKYLKEQGGAIALNRAANDLRHISRNTTEFDQAVCLLTVVEIKAKEFCHMLAHYDDVKATVYKEKIKREICSVRKAIRKSGCYKHKDKKRLRLICKNKI